MYDIKDMLSLLNGQKKKYQTFKAIKHVFYNLSSNFVDMLKAFIENWEIERIVESKTKANQMNRLSGKINCNKKKKKKWNIGQLAKSTPLDFRSWKKEWFLRIEIYSSIRNRK